VSGPNPEDESLDGAPVPELEPERRAGATRTSSLKHKTATSILWTVVRTGSDYFLSFLVFAVLARKLGPEAFGVFALAAAFAELVRILPTAGFTTALQRARTVSPEMADTVLWASLAVASLGAAALALLARPIAHLVGEPAVAPLLVGLGLTLPISAAGGTHIALMLREFGHKAMASRSVVSNVLGGAAGLAAAWHGWGAWSLLAQRGVAELAGTVTAWQVYPWRPGRAFSTRVLRELSGYSITMTYSQMLFVALVRVQDVIIGRFLGVAAVGQYRTAWRTVELIARGVIMPFTQVALPTLGRLQDDRGVLRRRRASDRGIRSARPRRDSARVRCPVGARRAGGAGPRPHGGSIHPQPLRRAGACHPGTLHNLGTPLHSSARPDCRDEHRCRAIRPRRGRGGLRCARLPHAPAPVLGLQAV
jgi:Polysaccharide biosynthesis protein